MEILLAVILPIAILAGCLVAIRVVRNKQRSGAVGNMVPTTDGEASVEGHGERVDADRPVELREESRPAGS